MHPQRALWEWYNIVHCTPLIKNQDVNTRHLGFHPPFLMVQDNHYETRKCVQGTRMPRCCKISIFSPINHYGSHEMIRIILNFEQDILVINIVSKNL